jgi:hypothetical protein
VAAVRPDWPGYRRPQLQFSCVRPIGRTEASKWPWLGRRRKQPSPRLWAGPPAGALRCEAVTVGQPLAWLTLQVIWFFRVPPLLLNGSLGNAERAGSLGAVDGETAGPQRGADPSARQAWATTGGQGPYGSGESGLQPGKTPHWRAWRTQAPPAVRCGQLVNRKS